MDRAFQASPRPAGAPGDTTLCRRARAGKALLEQPASPVVNGLSHHRDIKSLHLPVARCKFRDLSG